ncbi:MAG: cbb3-type cytochrome oxidase assembly protein CcoS [Candidatus Reddybacter sp.]
MESLYFLIPLSMLVVALGVRLFFWAVNSGQYDDLDGEAERILFDEIDLNTKVDRVVRQESESPNKGKPEAREDKARND